MPVIDWDNSTLRSSRLLADAAAEDRRAVVGAETSLLVDPDLLHRAADLIHASQLQRYSTKQIVWTKRCID
jgi:hypothetical protein